MFRLLTVQDGSVHVDMRFNFEKCYNKIVELANAAKEAREAAADAAGDTQEMQSSLSDLTERYKQLYEAKNGH